MKHKLVLRISLLVSAMLIGNGGALLTQSTTKVLIFPRLGQARQVASFPQNLTWSEFIKGDVVYNNVAMFQTGIAFTNAGSESATVTLTAIGEDGQPLAGPDIINPSVMPMDDPRIPGQIPAGMQVARYVWQIFGKGILGKVGYIKAECTGGDIKAYYAIYDDGFDCLSLAEPSPLEKAGTRKVLPLLDRRAADSGGFFSTKIDIVNVEDFPIVVTIKQWAIQNGGDRGTGPGSYFGFYVNYPEWTTSRYIPAHGKIELDWSYEALIWAGANFPGNNYLVVTSENGSFLGSEVILRNDAPLNVNRTHSISVVTGMSQEEGFWEKTTIGRGSVRPHITAGYGWFTQLLVFGPGFENRLGDENGTWLNWGICGYDSSGNPTTKCDTNLEGTLGEKAAYNVADLFTYYASPTGLVHRPVPAQLNGSLHIYLDYSRAGPEEATLDWVVYGPTNPDGTNSDSFRSVVPPTPATTSACYPHVAEGEFAPGQSFGMGMAFADTRSVIQEEYKWIDPRVNHIILELYRSDGTLLQTTGIDLCMGCKIAKTLPELFPGMKIPQLGGYIKARGTTKFVNPGEPAGILPFASFAEFWVVKDGKIKSASMIPGIPLN
jgi:hypothetical protein